LETRRKFKRLTRTSSHSLEQGFLLRAKRGEEML